MEFPKKKNKRNFEEIPRRISAETTIEISKETAREFYKVSPRGTPATISKEIP